MRNLLLAALALLSLSVLAEHPAWVTYGPNGPLALTIVDGAAECPHITIDGRRERMRVRSLPGKLYPVTGCEAALPANVTSASIGDRALPVAKLGRTGKIAILGDTGCRRAVGYSGKPSIQDCNDPNAWPFKQVADSIAAWDPDLILNVGDYYYREAICKDGKCVKATYDWSRWNADWFTPAAKMLPSAPWVMSRGNHEDCSRAAEGWFRFLEPRPYLWEDVKTCNSNLVWTPPYDVRIGDLRVVVYDSSGISDWKVDPKEVQIMSNQLGLYANKAAGAWMMLHHPFWGYGSYGPETETMWTAWNAAGANVPDPALMLTGHMHLLEMVSYSDNRLPQLVVGNGGTSLDKPPTADAAKGQVVGGRTISDFYADGDFGWIAATHAGGAWTFDIRDKNGASKATCSWAEGSALSCK